MKHFEITVDLRTILNKDYEKIDSLSNQDLSDAINIAHKAYIEKERGNNRRMRNKDIEEDDYYLADKYSTIIKNVNRKLIENSDENIFFAMIKVAIHKLVFLLKVRNDEECNRALDDARRYIKEMIDDNISELLDEDEHLLSTDITENEVSVRRFYFEDMRTASHFGVDIDSFMKKIKEYNYGSDFEHSNEENFLDDYDIEKALSYDEFCEIYKELMYNKNFSDEINRIYSTKNKYKVKINPVHYEVTTYDEEEKINMFKALGVALYSNGRIKNKKLLKIKVDVGSNYVSNETLQLILDNSVGGFVFIEFEVYHSKRHWTVNDYLGRTQIRTKELTDNILAIKDDVQFLFYMDKYQDKVRDAIYDEIMSMNIVTIEDRLVQDIAVEYVENLAKAANVEVNDTLKQRVMIYGDDICKKEASDIFEDYKEDIIKNKYFPEYKDYYENKGNNDNIVNPYDALMAMPGLKNVKKMINDIINLHNLNIQKRERFLEYKDKNRVVTRYDGNTIPMHMLFMGNPGTCKTTVAKMIAKIFKSYGITKTDRTEFYGVDGRCIHLENAFKYAKGGILFIDEAYRLGESTITDLVALMENHRKDVIVILAGYTNAMRQWMHINEGINSRIKYKIEFEDYNEEELWEILEYQAKEKQLIFEDGVKEKIIGIFASAQCDKEMGNGRLVRNVLEMALMNQARRLADTKNKNEKISFEELNTLTLDDFDIDIKAITGKKPQKIIGNVDPEIELNNMIGLENIKSMVNKFVASAYMNKIRSERLGNKANGFIDTPMHLAFLGNPGTAKTTMARLVARMLKKKGVIKKDTIVEVGRKNLVANIVGETAKLVHSQFEKAKGGVLFIDEAYSLVDDRRGSFGDEAINTIIEDMENYRDDVIVIFAGYTDRMRAFIDVNEGLRSRLSYIFEFQDYNEKELYEIFEKMIRDERINVTDDAKNEVKNIIANVTKEKDYGNGRYIRKMLENAKINMNYRLSKNENADWTDEELNTLIIDDFRDLEDDKVLTEKDKSIGFVA